MSPYATGFLNRRPIRRIAMSYAQTFADLLTSQGVPVDADAVPDQQSVDSDLRQLSEWLRGLDDDTRAAIDQVTAENRVQVGLADDAVGIVQSLGGVLTAFDDQPEEIPVTTTVEMLFAVSAQAANALRK
jgi:hypothetical protein